MPKKEPMELVAYAWAYMILVALILIACSIFFYLLGENPLAWLGSLILIYLGAVVIVAVITLIVWVIKKF